MCPPRRPGLGHVRFMVDKMALGQVFSEYFGFLFQSAFHQLLHNHHHLSSGAGTIGQTVAAVPRGLSLTPLRIIKIQHIWRKYCELWKRNMRVCACLGEGSKFKLHTVFLVLSTRPYFEHFLPALWCGYWIDRHRQETIMSIILVQVFHIVLSHTNAHVSDSFAIQSPQVFTSLWIQASVIWPTCENG
jgi:hypothetical protein